MLEAVRSGASTVPEIALALASLERAHVERVRRRVRRLVAEHRLVVDAHPAPAARWAGGVVPARYSLPA